METWAHGQDVVDALGVDRPPTDRLRHVAHIGVRARPFSYVDPRDWRCPTSTSHVEPDRSRRRRVGVGRPGEPAIASPGRRSTSASSSRSAGTSPTRTSRSQGDAAVEWIRIAQAFAGPPGPGRRSRSVQRSLIRLNSSAAGRPTRRAVARRGGPRIRVRNASSWSSSTAFIVDSNWLSWASSAASLPVDVRRRRPRHGRARRPPTAAASSGGGAASPCSRKKCGSRAATMPSHDEEAGVAVVGVQAIALPRIVSEHDVGTEPPDPAGHLAALPQPALELAVDQPRKTTSPRRRRAARRGGALLVLARGDERGGVGVGVPRALRSVGADRGGGRRTRPSAHLASVPPRRTRRRRDGRRWPAPPTATAGRRDDAAQRHRRGQGRLAGFVGSHAAAPPARAGGRGRRACRCRGRAAGRATRARRGRGCAASARWCRNEPGP